MNLDHNGPIAQRVYRGGLLTATLAMAITLALAAPPTAFAPDGIDAKRHQLAEIEADVARVDVALEGAAEAYNGARYRLSDIEERIHQNTGDINTNERSLARARIALGDRLRALYVHPPSSTAEVLLTSTSVTAVTERLDLLERTTRLDANVVGRIRTHRVALDRARKQLQTDQKAATRELATAEQERERVAGLLQERQQVLGQVKGDLARLLRAKQEAERRQAAVQAQQARDRVAATPQAAAPAATPASSSEPTPSAPLPSGGGNSAAVALALEQLGVPYKWAGASPSEGFDCSGLLSYVYGKLGKSVPHYTGAIWASFPKVPREQLQPGDIVFYRADLGHAGMYMGGGQYVHAPQTGDVVKVTSMSSRSDYQGAVRP
ncbi:MAG: NlpC/P60 family protein [Thermoleophilia bacterium]|nr:NlpC/P60 family protein [Thermoleophilia bacterium]MDH3724623.1 NlpC/P60 family protein [Thermoleophilia bacterium]